MVSILLTLAEPTWLSESIGAIFFLGVIPYLLGYIALIVTIFRRSVFAGALCIIIPFLGFGFVFFDFLFDKKRFREDMLSVILFVSGGSAMLAGLFFSWFFGIDL